MPVPQEDPTSSQNPPKDPLEGAPSQPPGSDSAEEFLHAQLDPGVAGDYDYPPLLEIPETPRAAPPAEEAAAAATAEKGPQGATSIASTATDARHVSGQWGCEIISCQLV